MTKTPKPHCILRLPLHQTITTTPSPSLRDACSNKSPVALYFVHFTRHGVARGAVGLHPDTKLATRLPEVDPLVAIDAVA
jgi:hypothetical protein